MVLLHSLAELIFDGMIVVLLAFNSEALCFFPLSKHDWLNWMTFGCYSKVLGAASSVRLPYCRMQHDCVTRQLQPFIVVVSQK